MTKRKSNRKQCERGGCTEPATVCALHAAPRTVLAAALEGELVEARRQITRLENRIAENAVSRDEIRKHTRDLLDHLRALGRKLDRFDKEAEGIAHAMNGHAAFRVREWGASDGHDVVSEETIEAIAKHVEACCDVDTWQVLKRDP